MDKKILIVYYSQTGQLKEIVDRFSAPFIENKINVEVVKIPLLEEFAFPWTAKRFFDAMPESVLGIPSKLGELKFKESSYDLIVIAYQPWYLSPSIPTTSIFKNPEFKKILKGSHVVTLIGSRNMWISAQEKMKLLIQDAGAKLVGNIALVDKHTNLASGVSILHWMLNGKKDKFLGIFPKPGVSDEDINNSNVFGKIVSKRILENNFAGLQDQLVGNGAVEVKPNLMFIEPRANKLFSIWANVIIKKTNRQLWLSIFKYYLIIALFIVSPIVVGINVLLRPLFLKSIATKKKYYLGLD